MYKYSTQKYHIQSACLWTAGLYTNHICEWKDKIQITCLWMGGIYTNHVLSLVGLYIKQSLSVAGLYMRFMTVRGLCVKVYVQTFWIKILYSVSLIGDDYIQVHVS